jgi:hypothetical protein
MSARKRSPTSPKDKLHVFHIIMRVPATPAKLVGVVRATNKQAALVQAIESYRIPPHAQKCLIVLRTA